MYEVRPNLVIGFHGCDIRTRTALLKNPDSIIYSKKPFDWLGHGMYFWENNYERAMQWAKEKKTRGEIKTPAIIGGVLHLGYCFDLLDSRFIEMLKAYYKLMESKYNQLNIELPRNKDLPHDKHKDKILRELDCTTIEYMHQSILDQIINDKKEKGYSNYKMFDSARGVFTEGGPVFPGAGISEKSHIQICIRNANCIQGLFLPRNEIDFSPESILKERSKKVLHTRS